VRRSDPTQARPAASSGPTGLPRPVAAAVGLAAVGSCAVRSVPGALIRLPFVGLRRAIIGAAAIMASYEDATVTEHLRSGPSGEVGAAPLGVDESDAVSAADLPVPDYDRLSPAALRARLRRLDASQLALLRDHERTHADRLPVLTMLDSRIARLTAQAGGDAGG